MKIITFLRLRLRNRQWLAVLRLVGGCAFLASAQAGDYHAAQNGQTPEWPYTSWTSAASNIQDAINAASPNDTVWVGAGRYTVPTNTVVYLGASNVVYIDKPLTLRSSNGAPADVTIDGDGAHRGIAWNYTLGTSNRFLLEGFIISNCYAVSNGGGMIYANAGNWTGEVRNCLFTHNTAYRSDTGPVRGGAVYAYRIGYFVYLFSNCTFRANQTTNIAFSDTQGGAVYLTANQPGGSQFADCLFENNSAAAGGACYFASAIPAGTNVLERCRLYGNSAATNANASHGGGAIYQYGSPLTMWNCLVYSNTSTAPGGAIRLQTSAKLFLYNCTLAGNASTAPSAEFAGGIQTRHPGDKVEVYNSIVHSNLSYISSNPDITFGGAATNSYMADSCIGSTNGFADYDNIITNSPLFADYPASNFRLQKHSPCINAGSNQSWMANAMDLDRRSRLDQFFRRVDMGCYEYRHAGSMFISH